MSPAVVIESNYQWLSELRQTSDLTSLPLFSQDMTDDLSDAAEEVFISAVLAGRLPPEPQEIHARIEPTFQNQPSVEQVTVHLTTSENGNHQEYSGTFATGRWNRKLLLQAIALRQQGVLEESEQCHRMTLAMPRKGNTWSLPAFEAPTIIDGTLEDFGVREMEAGQLDPDRPILVNRRLASESVDACLAADVRETGKAVLGVHVRLPAPLPETSTRIVTLLTACLDDHRHSGEIHEWKISPEALADAAGIADLRGLGERVVTVVHTHGWSNSCGNCNDNANCPLAECTHVSLKDYQVLETLFPSKATLMPIAGRKLGVAAKRPVLVIHAWRGGEMKPAEWRPYRE